MTVVSSAPKSSSGWLSPSDSEDDESSSGDEDSYLAAAAAAAAGASEGPKKHGKLSKLLRHRGRHHRHRRKKEDKEKERVAAEVEGGSQKMVRLTCGFRLRGLKILTPGSLGALAFWVDVQQPEHSLRIQHCRIM